MLQIFFSTLLSEMLVEIIRILIKKGKERQIN
jgi:hypothetical protein